MSPLSFMHHKARFAAMTAATSAILMIGVASAHGIRVSQSGEQKDMLRVGHSDIQGRESYQPNVITYPDGRVIAFIGTHGGTHFNPLTGVDERNGTMIVDITNPARPKDLFHIPQSDGTSQMARMCKGSDLGVGNSNSVYLMRNYGHGYETWDVTDPKNPKFLASTAQNPAIGSMPVTHKLWWECKSGIAYLPGSRASDGYKQPQSMVIVDWKDPTLPPNYIRTFTLPGGEPGGTGAPSLHGAISAEDKFPGKNRVYAAWGVGSNGVITILDRDKLLTTPDSDLTTPVVGRLDISPDQGGHTTMPVFGLQPPSMQDFAQNKTRDIIVVTSEATANKCQEAPHWAFTVDMTTEDKMWNLATMWVDPRSGEKYPRGNYCARGARFGVHSVEENFDNPYYGRLTFLAYFAGGIRAWDIREPQGPQEVGFYVGVANANTQSPGYMWNNVEVDDRGYIITAGRVGSGLDVLKLCGKAKQIGLGKKQSKYDDCRANDDDDYDHYDRHDHH
jgi:hypothetical protein